MVTAAILTPGTDPVSQIILAVPLVLLYEISILISKLSAKKT
jgi:sec-independent protein translocase protein TatC